MTETEKYGLPVRRTCGTMRENAAETVRKCASGKKRGVTAIGYGNSIKCRPQQAAERKM